MKISLCYVCPVVNWPQFEPAVRRFVATSAQFPAEFPHELHVVCNGGGPGPAVRELFSGRQPIFHEHDNTGWDIGAYRRVAADADCDFMFFLNTFSHFRRAGWLRQLAVATEKFGPGLFAPSASFDIVPHLRTTAFLCPPELVRAWTGAIVRPGDRHQFEVGRRSLTALAGQRGQPAVLVTWDGFWRQPDWRKPPDIFRRGDQSNCLVYDRHHEIYEAASPAQKIRLGRVADGNKFEFYRCAIEARLGRWFKPTNKS